MNRKLKLFLLAFAAVVCFQARLVVVRANAATGPITLSVDATEAPRKLFHARITMPVVPGPMTLVYPKWIPGEHGPTGPIINLAGVKITAGGKTVPWRRDDVEMYAFHFEVPAGAREIEVAAVLASVGKQRREIRWNGEEKSRAMTLNGGEYIDLSTVHANQ